MDLVLYIATGCHLCPPAQACVEEVVADLPAGTVSLRVVDIDGDIALERRYREAIPVLELDGRELQRYVFDAPALRRAMGLL
jgi:hypothetical protein